MGQTHTVGTHKTTVATSEGVTRVTYQSTVVVEWDGYTIKLNTGGWRTNTTKTRMNQASNQFDLGYAVFQKNYEWYVDYKGTVSPFNDDVFIIQP